jgi:uncharacterized YkwD family protein
MKKWIQKSVAALLLASTLLTPCLATAEAGTSYVVKRGDTLSRIAKQFGVGVTEIVTENNLKNQNNIYPGQTLVIPVMDQKVDDFQNRVVALTNAERAKYGLPALKMNPDLQRMARIKSEDMRNKNYFDHHSPTFGSPFDMMKQFGISYSYAGENIAAGQQSPEDVVKAWMNSPGHRANILKREYTQIGCGVATGGSYRIYWSQEFIRQ